MTLTLMLSTDKGLAEALGEGLPGRELVQTVCQEGAAESTSEAWR